MYVRTISRKNKDGSTVEYVQLAHNVRHPKKKYAEAEVLYSFGRRDRLDVEAIKRLVNSLSRFIQPEEAKQLEAAGKCNSTLKFISSRPAGGAYLLYALWKHLKIGNCLMNALKERSYTAPIEEALFALVANRALDAKSKLAVEEWAQKDVWLGNKHKLQVQHFYRGMDFLLEHEEEVQKEIFWSTANLLNLKVDLIFFDTTNTYFEIDDPGDSELKAYCRSKHKRDDLPHVCIGLAVTKEGIPVRCWVMPGNQNDSKCVDQIQKDLNDWKLNRVIWVMDRGMTSDENRVILQRAGGHYIFGEKIRSGNANKEALNRGGRFKILTDNVHVKEVRIEQAKVRRRFVIVYNPQEAEHDKKTREKILERIKEDLKALKNFSKEKQTREKYLLLAHKAKGRFLKEDKNGKLGIDHDKVMEEEKLDGKYLLSSSDESLTAEDVAMGYKQLYEVERAFRTLKSTLSLRPMYHTKDERIRCHVLLCWIALLLIRIAEVETGLTWDRIRAVMERLHIGEFSNKEGRVFQYSELTGDQRNILKKLNIKPPKLIEKVILPQ